MQDPQNNEALGFKAINARHPAVTEMPALAGNGMEFNKAANLPPVVRDIAVTALGHEEAVVVYVKSGSHESVSVV